MNNLQDRHRSASDSRRVDAGCSKELSLYENMVRGIRKLVLVTIHWLLFGRRKIVDSPDKILVLRFSAVGDFIISIPAINTLRAAFEGADIALLTMTSSVAKQRIAVSNYNGSPDLAPWIRFVLPSKVNRAFTLDSLRLGYLLGSVRREIKRYKADIVFILPQQNGGTVRSLASKMILLKMLGVRSPVFGCLSGSGPLLRGKHFKEGRVEHAVMAPLNAVCEHPRVSACFGGQIGFGLDIPLEEKLWARALIKSVRGDSNVPVIAISISSVHTHKQWGSDRFAALIRTLAEKIAVRILLVGTRSSGNEGGVIASQFPRVVTNLCGETSITQLAAVLEMCDLTVGNDGGSMHLASAVGSRCVAIMPGIEYPGSIEPWGAIDYAIREPVACSPCYSFTNCPMGDNRCMRAISVERVAQRCIQALSNDCHLSGLIN